MLIPLTGAPKSRIILGPSGDTTGVTDAAQLTAAASRLPSTGGLVTLVPSAQWYIKGGQVVINASNVRIDAPGCFINAVGTGDTIRMYDSSPYNPRTIQGGGITGFPIIDGTNAGAGSTGLHVGDILQLQLYAQVQNFTGAGSIGILIDDANFWTEQLQGSVHVSNCTTMIVFDESGAVTSQGSFARLNLLCFLEAGTALQNGVVVRNGSTIYDGKLGIYGNFSSSASGSPGAVLTITGQAPAGHPDAGNWSAVKNSQLDIAIESGTGAVTATTLNFGASSNQLSTCYGVMDFLNFSASNNAGNFYRFFGTVIGDTSLPSWLPQISCTMADGPQLISSTTPANVSFVAVPVAPFTPYKVHAVIPYSSTSVAGTPVFSFTGPSMAKVALTAQFLTAAYTAPTVHTAITDALTGPTLTNSANLCLVVQGTILPAAAGTLQLTAAEGTNGDTFTVQEGAYIEVLASKN